ncbi:MAG: hypothetical protein RH862_19330 [Leptospiraceae bacterium]
MPWYSGRQVLVQGIPDASGLRFRLVFSGRSDHSKQSSGAWEKKPEAALWLRCSETSAEITADLLTVPGCLRIQALNEKTIYLDLHQDGALLFSGKVHRSLWALRIKLLPGSLRKDTGSIS